jgi:hypothetical protein
VAVLARIERVNLVLAVLVTALAGLLWGKSGAIAAGVGAALACADFYVLVRLGARLVAQARTGAPSRALSFLLLTKTKILFGLVFIAIRVAQLDPIPFALGFSVFVVSIFLLGLQAGKNAYVEP